MGGVKIAFGLLTLVTIGMIIGALFQVAFIRQLEESSGSKFSISRRMRGSQNEGRALLLRGLALWANDEDAHVLRLGLIKPEVVSWSPRITVFHNFLSPEECDYLKAISRPRLQISTVVDAKTGKGIKSNVRTSSGMFLSSTERKYPMIQEIEKRIAVYSQVPAENGELIQVLRYEKNQYYKPHHDYFSDTFNLKRGGQRIATMLMYLSDNVQGGETYFPMEMKVNLIITDYCMPGMTGYDLLKQIKTLWVTVLNIVGQHVPPFVWLRHSAARIQEHILQAGDGECSCGEKMVKGLCVKPNKGDAVLFWSMDLDGTSDAKSVHGSCEVLDGEKWSATKWMRQKTSS